MLQTLYVALALSICDNIAYNQDIGLTRTAMTQKNQRQQVDGKYSGSKQPQELGLVVCSNHACAMTKC
jgi:hypothetical protein